MTGTSLDGLDVALVEIAGTGLEMSAVYRGMVSRPLGALADTLRHFAEGGSAPPIDYMRAARALGQLHADAVSELCERVLRKQLATTAARPATLDFVVAHGQTIWHAPPVKPGKQESTKAGNKEDEPRVLWAGGGDVATSLANAPCEAAGGLSWQLFDPWPLVRRLGVPVCYDLRQADLIAGGQGAPITPLADWIIYNPALAPRPRAIGSLGGICKVPPLRDRAEDTTGRDVGPCNILLDTVVQRLFPGTRYDEDGAIARRGNVVDMLHKAIVSDALTILKEQQSLGRENFPLSVIDGWLATATKHESNEDIVATYTAAVADLVGVGIRRAAGTAELKQVILAGGGARNPVLVEHITKHDMLRVPVTLSNLLYVPCEAREAMAFAVLGALSQDGVPITLEQVTGAKGPGRAGAWVYP